MDNLYEQICALCKERGIKPGRICADTGLSRGMMSDLKMGRTKALSAKNMKIIADYFHVTVDYLLGGEVEREPAPAQVSGPQNVVKIAGRDGSYSERRLTDQQIAALKAIIEQMPEADDL
jgi:transcriptional regulator with XRE-family HTH domain